MHKLSCSLLLVSIMGIACLAIAPQPAQAQDYWTNHWAWYDNVYRPYYYRSYYSSPGFYSGPSYSYGPGYAYGPGYYGTPYRSYYGAPGVGYGRMYGGRQAVNVGPLTFGWR
jgi:hypothetical protein